MGNAGLVRGWNDPYTRRGLACLAGSALVRTIRVYFDPEGWVRIGLNVVGLTLLATGIAFFLLGWRADRRLPRQ